MKVLFISRAKQNQEISPLIQTQADSISRLLDLHVFSIKGKGWKAYIHSISKLRKYINSHNPELVHAHYSFVGMIAALATKKPIVVSLMGSDIEDYRIGRMLIHVFNILFWNTVIVKSQRSKDRIGIKKAYVIPNGVNLDVFTATDHSETRKKLGWDAEKKYVLFLADPSRPEKNYPLAKKACNETGKQFDIELLALNAVPHKLIPEYMSAANVLLLTSHFEGSPNAIKEAMACNCPIVSTDVGDVKEVIGDTEGYYITSFEAEDVAEKLKMALDFGKRTNGREKIKHLDDKIIAQKLVEVYESVLK